MRRCVTETRGWRDDYLRRAPQTAEHAGRPRFTAVNQRLKIRAAPGRCRITFAATATEHHSIRFISVLGAAESCGTVVLPPVLPSHHAQTHEALRLAAAGSGSGD